jgi:hypothetical protein
MKKNWDYRILKSNCQHFASYLLQVLTGHEPLPRTISRLMKDYIPVSHQPPYPLNSNTGSIANSLSHSLFGNAGRHVV